MKKILEFILGGISNLISGLVSKIFGFLLKILSWILGLLVGLVSKLFSVIGNLLSILPASPFQQAIDGLGDFEFLGYMNYFIPFQAIKTILAVWIGAVAIYMVYKLIKKYTNIFGVITHFIGG